MGIVDAARRVLPALLLLGAALCAAAPLWVGRSFDAAAAPQSERPADAWELPREWDGRPLRPLALSTVEQRFAAQFPGRIARLTDGDAVLVWRRVERPTRMLHPAADCYRALGYRIEHAVLEDDASARRWRCFDAVQGAQRLRVCERIEDARGNAFTDASSWYWATQLGSSTGPWLALTVTRTM
jgi:hypothetical protein